MIREDYNAKHREYQRQQRIRERQSWRQFKSTSTISQERRAREEEKRQKLDAKKRAMVREHENMENFWRELRKYKNEVGGVPDETLDKGYKP